MISAVSIAGYQEIVDRCWESYPWASPLSIICVKEKKDRNKNRGKIKGQEQMKGI